MTKPKQPVEKLPSKPRARQSYIVTSGEVLVTQDRKEALAKVMSLFKDGDVPVAIRGRLLRVEQQVALRMEGRGNDNSEAH